MASAEKRGTGPKPWRARYKKPDGSTGSEPGFRTRKAAVDWGNDQEAAIRAGRWIDPKAGEMTFGEWAGKWLPAQDLARSTLERYGSRLRVHILPAWQTVPLANITPIAVQAWVTNLGKTLKSSTIKGIRGMFVTMLDDAIAEKLIQDNPARKPRRRGRYVDEGAADEEEVWASVAEVIAVARNVRALAGDGFALMVLLGAFTGMRWGELIGLKREFVWSEGHLVRVEWQLLETDDKEFVEKEPKYGSRRTIALPAFLAALLWAYVQTLPEGREHLFLAPRGGHPYRGNFRTAVWRPAVDGAAATRRREALAKAGPAGLKVHGLRHGHRVYLDELGTPPVAIRQRLGHKRPKGVEGVYPHVSEAMEQAVISGLEAVWQEASKTAMGAQDAGFLSLP